MSESKLISVFGASGQQGGSVVRALIKDGFKVRALTRDTNSEASKELLTLGTDIEVVKCSEADPLEDIEVAIKGSYGVFSVTNYWSYFEKEVEYGINMAKASFNVGVKHFVYSSLPHYNKLSNGKYKGVPHFDGKNEIEQYARELSIKNPAFVSSFVYIGFYMENIGNNFPYYLNPDGKSYYWPLPWNPSSKYPIYLIAIKDFGPIVSLIFLDPENYSGCAIPVTSQSKLNGIDIAEKISKATGKTFTFKYIPPEEYAKSGADHGEELCQMFQFFNEFGYFHTMDTTISHNLIKMSSFDDFLINFKFNC